MALVVEDGTGVATANSYVSVADADNFFLDRADTTWAAASEAAKEGALVRAAEFLDHSYEWKGVRTHQHQAMKWPRFGVLDEDGYPIPSHEVPQAVISAQLQLALAALAGDLLPTLTREAAIIRRTEKVGSLEETVEYAESGPMSPVYGIVDRLLRGVSLGSSGGFGSSLLLRG